MPLLDASFVPSKRVPGLRYKYCWDMEPNTSKNSRRTSAIISATGRTESMRPATWPAGARILASISPPKYRDLSPYRIHPSRCPLRIPNGWLFLCESHARLANARDSKRYRFLPRSQWHFSSSHEPVIPQQTPCACPFARLPHPRQRLLPWYRHRGTRLPR